MMQSETPRALTLSQLNRRIAQVLAVPTFQNVWVVAELSDVRINHGHCYVELIEKHPETGATLARLGAAIWASQFMRINAEFFAATGRRLESGLKVMACGTINFHPAFGMKFVITAIDPAYTMGEAERRRREIVDRLTREGVIDLNRNLEWPDVPRRIAVISARGAAGYGDFIHQLCTNPSRLRFSVSLFPAMMQGERTSPSIVAALEQIAMMADDFDCVVIIRGGGATSELMAFDDYVLANNIAQFPLPVIIGIGHERDVTVLDYVANMRVKTPTAAAEWLIGRGEAALDRLRVLASDIALAASGLLSGAKTHLAYAESSIAAAPTAVLERCRSRLQRASMLLAETGARRVVPELARIEASRRAIATAAANLMRRSADRLEAKQAVLTALSPRATLRRGFSITKVNGRVVRSIDGLDSGIEITTLLSDGAFTSKINQISPNGTEI